MSRRIGGSRMDRSGRPAHGGATARRIATLGGAVLLALVVGAIGGIVLFLVLGAP